MRWIIDIYPCDAVYIGDQKWIVFIYSELLRRYYFNNLNIHEIQENVSLQTHNDVTNHYHV